MKKNYKLIKKKWNEITFKSLLNNESDIIKIGINKKCGRNKNDFASILSTINGNEKNR